MYYYSGGYTAPNYQFPLMGRSNFGYQNQGWGAVRPPVAVHEPAVFVEEQQAKKVRNDVNVHKDTIKLVVDEDDPDRYLITFIFDAMFDGSITIIYFAKEEPNCKIVPVFPESYKPVKVPFQKGAGQKFRQPSRTGIDLAFFGVDYPSKLEEDVLPLVISAETYLPSLLADEQSSDHPPNPSPRRQITQAVLEEKDGEPFIVRVIKQILWIDDVRYELREIYGIGNSGEAISGNDSGKECVICMTEPKNTAVLPCRHMLGKCLAECKSFVFEAPIPRMQIDVIDNVTRMNYLYPVELSQVSTICLCSECAKTLRLQSNKCPICRQPIEELMEIKIDNDGQ
uniref:RING-type E3 ubiquitin transferase n=1 Tax=Daucus carota subsp. sativus TaxID=79200 RepID=A0A175YP86_DAUCS